MHHSGERGASAVEYALVLVGVAALIVLVVFSLGRTTNELFGDSCDAVKAKVDTTHTCD